MKPEEFYDAFGQKLLNDYIGGNPRMLAAVEFARSELARCRSRQVLDIGCGIGWSSFAFSQLTCVRRIVAVDLSAQLLAQARSLFSSPKIEYKHQDVTKFESSTTTAFDAIVMLDVYEHIPVKDRKAFHAALDSLLSPGGFVLLTCPTVSHQKYLRTHNPQGLQPVDEDVSLAELSNLAFDLSATIDFYRVTTIWRARDYLHAIIRRGKGSPPMPKHQLSKLAILMRKLRVRLLQIRNDGRPVSKPSKVLEQQPSLS